MKQSSHLFGGNCTGTVGALDASTRVRDQRQLHRGAEAIKRIGKAQGFPFSQQVQAGGSAELYAKVIQAQAADEVGWFNAKDPPRWFL